MQSPANRAPVVVEGLTKTYNKPFSPEVHDAMTADDYVWAQFIDNRIVPVGTTN